MEQTLDQGFNVKPKKITELTEVRKRTVHLKDAYGNRKRDTEQYITKRPVRTVRPGPRFGHFIIDAIAFQGVVYVVTYVFQILINATETHVNVSLTIALLSNLLLLVLYSALYAVCEYKWQRTPGKFLTKTLVIDEYGNKPDLRAIALRSLIRMVPFEPFSCLGDDNSHGWHDRWSRTWVVTEEELEKIKKLQEEQR